MADQELRAELRAAEQGLSTERLESARWRELASELHQQLEQAHSQLVATAQQEQQQQSRHGVD